VGRAARARGAGVVVGVDLFDVRYKQNGQIVRSASASEPQEDRPVVCVADGQLPAAGKLSAGGSKEVGQISTQSGWRGEEGA